ncbi:MAG: hypothetical protein K5629_00515 [Eubacteriales bacterium]|nr:hypothetical protein [Eubacteriales bacterium]
MKETADKKKQNNTEKPLKAIGRGKAIFIVILCIILAVFVGGRRGLMNERKEALSYFTGENYKGGQNNNHSEKDCVRYYIDERLSCANNLITLASYYIPNDSLVKNVKSEIDDLIDNDNPSSCYKHNEKLTAACNSLFEKLKNVIPEGDEYLVYAQGQIDKMVSAQQKMGHLEYNVKAETFNKLISRFPTDLVSRFTFVRALPLFTD